MPLNKKLDEKNKWSNSTNILQNSTPPPPQSKLIKKRNIFSLSFRNSVTTFILKMLEGTSEHFEDAFFAYHLSYYVTTPRILINLHRFC